MIYISDWINESKVLIEKKLIILLFLVGSSMGAWIAFYLSLMIKKKITRNYRNILGY